MTREDQVFEAECAALMNYLYTTAAHTCGDCQDIDILVQECMMVYLVKHARGEQISHPKAYLCRVLKNKYNEMLRDRYGNRIVSYEDAVMLYEAEPQDTAPCDEEYEMVRLLLGRLIRIHREVAVRHYVHGESVEQIALALDIPRGTVLSRLATARERIKEGMEHMEKYSSYSYAPKKVSIGIWGNRGMKEEPFSLIPTPMEQNALILAYENPVSVRGLADTMGVPCAYLEPVLDKLVEGELMGRTPGGLVYTRCFMQKYEDSFGDIPLQEGLAEEYATRVWEVVWRHLAPFTERGSVCKMTEKQKATLLLFLMRQALAHCEKMTCPRDGAEPKTPRERPNGGRWLATGTVMEPEQKKDAVYASSGPLLTTYRAEDERYNLCQMFDFQSVFGDTHWAFGRMKYKVPEWSIMRFLASFLPCDVKTDIKVLYDMIPDFEALYILRRDERGEISLDIPALPWEDVKVLDPIMIAMEAELMDLLAAPLERLWLSRTYRVPRHVDDAGYYRHADACGAYVIAQMLAIVKSGLMPYAVEIGKTPIMYIAYRPRQEEM